MKKIVILFVSILILTGFAFGADHWTESFENPGTWSGYTTGTVTFDSGDWDFVSVYPETSGDSYDGSKACRINDDVSGASITAPAVNSVGTVTFYYHRPYSGTGTLSLQKSVGGGAYTEITTQSFDAVTTPTEFSYAVNDVSNNIRIRVENDDNTAHLTIDYMTITDYSGLVDPEPTNHVADFTVTANGYDQIDLSWTENDGSVVPDGYLIKASTADNISDPSDGTAVDDNATIGDDSGAKNISHGNTSWEWTGLDAETQYYFKIYPYTNSGSDIDYKTDGTIPNGNATTDIAPEIPALIISEVTDPGDNSVGRFVELYNNTGSTIDFSTETWYLCIQINGGNWTDEQLSGSLSANDCFVFSYEDDADFNTLYGINPDQYHGNFNGNGDDGYFLYYDGDHSTGILADAYGVIDEDGSGKAWEYENSRAVRGTNQTVNEGNTTWTAAEWEITAADVADCTPGELEGDQSLPVTLMNFNANTENGNVVLTWTTASESENLGFKVYRRSVDENEKLLSSYTDNDDLRGQGNSSEKTDYEYIDSNIKTDVNYTYILKDVDYSGKVFKSGEVNITTTENNLTVTDKYTLGNTYPNPFNPTFTIPLTLKTDAFVNIQLVNILGQKVMQIKNKQMTTGNNDLQVNCEDLNSGVYFVNVTVDNANEIQKVILLK